MEANRQKWYQTCADNDDITDVDNAGIGFHQFHTNRYTTTFYIQKNTWSLGDAKFLFSD